MKPIKVMICDDHPFFVKGVAQGLEKYPNIEVVAVAYTGEGVIDKLKIHKVDIVLLDIELPDYNGFEIVKEITSFHAPVKVIALSMHDEANIIHRMMKFGAKGYLIKNTSVKELTEAIEAVHKGKTYLKGGVLSKVVEFSNKNQPNPIELLTEREIEIIKLVADGKSNNEIADNLFISIHTVHSHKKNMLKKLNLKNSVELISMAYKNKLISHVIMLLCCHAVILL